MRKRNIFAWLTKLLMTKQIDFKDGLIIFFGRPFNIIPHDLIVSITKAMMKSKENFEYFYFEAWKAGLMTVDIMNKRYKIKTAEERYTLAMDALALAGMGTYETIRFIPGKISHFRVYGNPVPLAFYPSPEPVDLFLRGINAGGGSIVHGRIINCIELKCAAQNGSFCEYVNGTKEVLFSEPFSEITKKQFPDFEKIYQMELGYIEQNKDKFSVEIFP